MTDWQPIETAPKDGTRVLLLGSPPTVEDVRQHAEAAYATKAERAQAIKEAIRPDMAPMEVGYWDAGGTSWVDQSGNINGNAHHLEVTGVWIAGGGWFQPNEVIYWMPLPEPPK